MIKGMNQDNHEAVFAAAWNSEGHTSFERIEFHL